MTVAIDDRLIARVQRLYRLRTKRETIDFALRSVVGTRERREMLDLRGTGWTGSLRKLRTSRV